MGVSVVEVQYQTLTLLTVIRFKNQPRLFFYLGAKWYGMVYGMVWYYSHQVRPENEEDMMDVRISNRLRSVALEPREVINETR